MMRDEPELTIEVLTRKLLSFFQSIPSIVATYYFPVQSFGILTAVVVPNFPHSILGQTIIASLVPINI